MTDAEIDTVRHKFLDGKVQLYQRPGSPHWQCSCTIAGKQKRTTTKEESLARAKDVARDWYLGLLGKYRQGEIRDGTPFTKAAKQFLAEYEAITEGERNPQYVKSHGIRIRVHLTPFFKEKMVEEITPGLVQEYRAHRMKTGTRRDGSPQGPSRSTLHKEIVTLRLILKTAQRHGWLNYLPDLSAPYKASRKVSHRAWFSPEEYKQLYKATGDRAKNPKKERWRGACEDMHDYVLFMVNSGLRPDEALRIELRDMEIVREGPKNERILHIAVRGKRGVGYCKTMPGAVFPFERLRKRHKYGPKDKIFPTIQRELFNTILNELDMKKDREGNARTTYSLRHTYISFRLMEGADIYQVAKNCRTSVEMIEKHYAAHIKDMIDASAINTMKPRP